VAAELAIYLGWDRGAGDHAVLAGDDASIGAGAVRHCPARGDVVLGAVFGQGPTHGVRQSVGGDGRLVRRARDPGTSIRRRAVYSRAAIVVETDDQVRVPAFVRTGMVGAPVTSAAVLTGDRCC